MRTLFLPKPLALLLTLTFVLGSAVALVAPAEAAISTSAEARFVELINNERAKRGLKTLAVRSDLVNVARDHSVDMARKNDLHHNPDLGSDVSNWKRLTENVGVGPDAATLHKAFMDSSGHRANILDSKVTEIGVGVEVRNNRMWVTEIFRLPQDPSKSPSGDSGSVGSTSSTTDANSRCPVPSGHDVRPLTGDWDGDGYVTPGWFVDGRFILSNRHNGNGPCYDFQYGIRGDLPLVGDWNGDRIDTVGIVRDGEWHLINHHKGGRSQISFVYGRVLRGDIPLAGDWDGNGTDTPAIVRDGEWHLINHFKGGASQISFVYGRVLRGDIPLVGDWNRDGTDTAGIIRDGEWHLVNGHRGGRADVSFLFGRVSQGDVPVVGDWDRDGDTNVGVVRSGTWYYRYHHAGGNADSAYTWK